MPACMIFFPGDVVRVPHDGKSVRAVIQGFEHDLPALRRGEPGDIAIVRLAGYSGGGIVKVPAADLDIEPCCYCLCLPENCFCGPRPLKAKVA